MCMKNMYLLFVKFDNGKNAYLNMAEFINRRISSNDR